VKALKKGGQMKGRLSFVVWLFLFSMASVAIAQQNATSGKTQIAINAHPTAGTVATDDPSYVIGPQDVVDISVWKEPDLTRTIPVRPDGKISMPLLNDVQAAGLTPLQLAAQITNGLRKFVNEPQVTVIVNLINSQRIYILGEVSRAGAYPLLPQMTVLQALSSAGGFTIFAKVKSIYLLRTENGKQQKFPFNYKDALAGRHAEQNIQLRAGDTIIVP
jgi:polysaccharide export outer membrane protein